MSLSILVRGDNGAGVGLAGTADSSAVHRRVADALGDDRDEVVS